MIRGTLNIIILLVIGTFNSLVGQTNVGYSGLEEQFTKDDLSPSDSIAFQLQAEQKIQQLLNLSALYQDTHNSNESLLYIKSSSNRLFTNEPLTDSRSTRITSLLSTLGDCTALDSIDIKWSPFPSHFGALHIISCDLIFPITLIKESKKFGKSTTKVWQIYLCYPNVYGTD